LQKNVKSGLEIIPVKNIDEVLKLALTKDLVPSKWIDIENKKDESQVRIQH